MWNLLEGTVPILAPSGYLAEVTEACVACGTCVDQKACHFHAIRLDGEGGSAAIDPAKCMGCGVCEDVCPNGAVRMRRDPSKGEPLDIEALKARPAGA